MKRLLVFASFLVVLAVAAIAQQTDFSKVEIKAQKVAGNIYMLTGEGGNIGLSVGDDGVVVVDDQFAPLAPKIQAAIKALSSKPIRYVLNTHWHFDHTGGNEAFARLAPVVAHENVRSRMENGTGPGAMFKVAPAPKGALPVITFTDSVTLHVNGDAIRALHYAGGHTDGDSIIFFPASNVVHMGDTYVTYGFPFVDTESGGTLRGMIANVEKAMAAVPDDVKVIPGHGPVGTKADVLKFTVMLRDCVSLVQAAIDNGRTLEQAQADKVLAKYQALGKGFIKSDDFVALVYRELKGTPAAPRRHLHH